MRQIKITKKFKEHYQNAGVFILAIMYFCFVGGLVSSSFRFVVFILGTILYIIVGTNISK